jgi:hypothetical protein
MGHSSGKQHRGKAAGSRLVAQGGDGSGFRLAISLAPGSSTRDGSSECSMNCDQVFMVLTSGPFPTGQPSDVAVEDHLEQCPECWRIAEALRPAHDVFEESVPASEGRHLPGYWGDAIPARTAMAQVQQTALRTAALQDARQPIHVTFYHSPAAQETVGLRDVVRIMTFLLLVGSAAFGVAWLWQ